MNSSRQSIRGKRLMGVHDRLVELFRIVFDKEDLLISDEMTARDVPGWDSLVHINLMLGIEQEFGVRFKGNELAEFKNIGELKLFLINETKDTSHTTAI